MIGFRVSELEREELDNRRGDVSMSKFIKNLIFKEETIQKDVSKGLEIEDRKMLKKLFDDVWDAVSRNKQIKLYAKHSEQIKRLEELLQWE